MFPLYFCAEKTEFAAATAAPVVIAWEEAIAMLKAMACFGEPQEAIQ